MLHDYAARASGMQSIRYIFRPRWFPTLAAVVSIALMVKLGFWQYDKAEQKRLLQSTFDARLGESPAALPGNVSNIEEWRYRRIRATGRYETQYQILLDNQVEGQVAGYHVITPFRAENTKALLLVNRGWIPAGDRSRLPFVETPAGVVEIRGYAWVPGKYYELATPSGEWQTLWQNVDMARYATAVPFSVFPFILRLDASSTAGGFSRNWPQPAERIEKHVGYALQWWGFAGAALAIWVFVNLRRSEA